MSKFETVMGVLSGVLDAVAQNVYPSEMHAKYLADSFIKQAREKGFKDGSIRLGPYTFNFDEKTPIGLNLKSIAMDVDHSRYCFLDLYRLMEKISMRTCGGFQADNWTIKTSSPSCCLRVLYSNTDIAAIRFVDKNDRPIAIRSSSPRGYACLDHVLISGPNTYYVPPRPEDCLRATASAVMYAVGGDTVCTQWRDVVRILEAAIDKGREK